jgi:hypothetical protein
MNLNLIAFYQRYITIFRKRGKIRSKKGENYVIFVFGNVIFEQIEEPFLDNNRKHSLIFQIVIKYLGQ